MDISKKTKIPQFYNPIKQWISLKKTKIPQFYNPIEQWISL
jgi:hypothetical protein